MAKVGAVPVGAVPLALARGGHGGCACSFKGSLSPSGKPKRHHWFAGSQARPVPLCGLVFSAGPEELTLFAAEREPPVSRVIWRQPLIAHCCFQLGTTQMEISHLEAPENSLERTTGPRALSFGNQGPSHLGIIGASDCRLHDLELILLTLRARTSWWTENPRPPK